MKTDNKTEAVKLVHKFIDYTAKQCAVIHCQLMIDELKLNYNSYSHSEPKMEYNKGYFDCQRQSDKNTDRKIEHYQSLIQEIQNL